MEKDDFQSIPKLFRLSCANDSHKLREYIAANLEDMDCLINFQCSQFADASALILASKFGYHDVVSILLAVPGIDVNLLTIDGESALYLACSSNHPMVVSLLLNFGCHIANEGEFDCVRECCLWGFNKVLSSLLDHLYISESLDIINKKAYDGTTPLCLAVMGGF